MLFLTLLNSSVIYLFFFTSFFIIFMILQTLYLQNFEHCYCFIISRLFITRTWFWVWMLWRIHKLQYLAIIRVYFLGYVIYCQPTEKTEALCTECKYVTYSELWKQSPLVILQQGNFYSIVILCLWLRIIRRSNQGVLVDEFSLTDIFFKFHFISCCY